MKKSLSVLLLAVMVFVSLAACAPQTAEPIATEEPTEAVVEETEAVAEETEEVAAEPRFDDMGYKVAYS